MKIGFDARMVDHPGIGRYISSLLPEMIKLAPEDTFVLFGDPDLLARYAGKNVVIKKWKAPIYSLQEQFFCPSCKEELDVLHVPHFNIPLRYKGKMVVTIHDLIYLAVPDAVKFPMGKYYASYMISKSLTKADSVIAVSTHTKNDLSRMVGEKFTGKINVIYEAADDSFGKIEDERQIKRIKKKYNLEDNIILYVGSIKPHKNVGTLIKVYERLKKWGSPCQLVIAGRWDKKEDYLKKSIDNRHIKYIGEVPSEDLIFLYNAAKVLVHLSQYEGFGLTVLEAMKCGTPVVVSDSTSLPEITANSALKVSPLNVGQIADTVYNVLSNEHMRESMIDAGYDRASQFSWKKTALETLAAYKGSK